MSNSLPTGYQQYIHKSRYARFIEEEKKKESWTETVSRYINYISDHLKRKHKHIITNKGELEEAIINLDVMLSMRALMTVVHSR